jgi:predicted RNA binding protein YcfA (HicA-like mRNA interferase family)
LTHIIICVKFIAGRIRYKEEMLLKTYSSREVIKTLTDDGWFEVRSQGSHHQFKHPVKKGTVTVKHPDKDIPRKTLDSIERQSGLKFR